MKKLFLLLLLPFLLPSLLPSLAWAGKLEVKRAEKITQPAGMIDRVKKRTENSVTYQDSAHFYRGEYDKGPFAVMISTEPIHYLDDTGVWQRFNFDAVPDSVSGFTAVRTGKFSVSYDSTGAIRWQKGNGLLTFAPDFDRTNVDIDFSIGYNGLKAKYILLNSSAPTTLKWVITANDSLVDQHDKGKGNLKKAGKLRGMISELTATDATGKPVSLNSYYDKGSLFAELNTTGATYPIALDPSVVDSISKTASARLYNGGTVWLTERNAVNADNAYVGTGNGGTWVKADATNKQNTRFAGVFPMNTLSVPGIVDSVRFWVPTDGTSPPDSCIVSLVKGTFTTATPVVGWYNDFVGWADSGAYSVTKLDSTPLRFLAADGDGWKSTLLNRAGMDTLKNHMGVDSLRLMAISWPDIAGACTFLSDVANNANAPYLSIYYQLPNPPGITTKADTLKPAVVFVATIDSTGGHNPTVRGIKYWPKGGALAADTITVSKTGSFGTGTFALYADSLLTDTLYRYKAFATNSVATSYGAIDSFWTQYATTIIVGGSFYVDGRLVTGIH